LIIHPDRDLYDLYKFPELAVTNKGYLIKEEGVYFFGGKSEAGLASNQLRILKISIQFLLSCNLYRPKALKLDNTSN
jgi:hypothetical protein